MLSSPERARFSRQLSLAQIGESGQLALKAARVLCVGVGGLGCASALYLGAAGVGTIGLMDGDRVEESNLQRQVLFGPGDLGALKAEAAKMRLARLYPHTELISIPERLCAVNGRERVSSFDVVIEGSDDFETKSLASDLAAELGLPLVVGAANGLSGQLATFPKCGRPCYRCLYPQDPRAHAPRCEEAGILGAVTGMIGSLQALEAVKLIVGMGSEAPARVASFDGSDLSFESFEIRAAAECSHCAGEALKLRPIYEVCVSELKEAVEARCFLDVRELSETQDGIPGSLRWPLSRISVNDLPDIPRDAELVTCCEHGQKSKLAAALLGRAGHSKVASMRGGLRAWRAAII